MGDFEIDERVDITDVVCPMTFVKAKVAMEELEIGQVLAVTIVCVVCEKSVSICRNPNNAS